MIGIPLGTEIISLNLSKYKIIIYAFLSLIGPEIWVEKQPTDGFPSLVMVKKVNELDVL